MPESKLSPRRIDVVEKQRRAVELRLMGLDSPIQVEHGGSGVPIQHEMVSIELGDVTEALRVLAEVGAIRMAPDTPQLEGGVDGVYTPYSDS